ncbi:SDR family oxidoreductase [Simkania negevensis]|uniref:C-factor n=1 Tax=Simkania negevensis (strain ATCC VR-1471 / DSM 27360 / Z) TaxID=331113 RepID=F8L8V5_SIMNZ|nr:SDR family oxidoreductase [Simkania negevensis]MCB1066838.1 SDR family oxidoreductase [Simkania sp.]MCB1074013.1 SDR family oxidoreductase [Simkania sp.]MCP5490447.1 SDR family oxidoreductase [Chlamydiales bacterium]CCB89248.1 c-factor [Simkania negevensis Z]
MTKTALVTGVSRGIGQGFVKHLLSRGFSVIGTSQNPDSITPQKNLTVELLDIRDDEAIQALATKYENTPIDLMINNAGVLYADSQIGWGENPTEIGTLSRKGMMQTIEINAVSTVKMTEAFVPHIVKSNLKLIATISSGAGSITDNASGGFIAYRMSKAALNMGMQEFAIKLKDQGVHVLLLHPGWVQTTMGGPNAVVPIEESVLGMLKVIEKCRTYRSGSFYDYHGQVRPF